MEEQSRLEKSTGFTPDTKMGSDTASAQTKSSASAKASPTLKAARIKDVSKNSTGGASGSNLLAAQILAVQIMMGDYKALKDQAPRSWQTHKDGKIYWCASIPGHSLEIVDGILLVDGVIASRLIEKLLAVGSKSTGGG
jgi:hypothetical protein